MNFFVQCLMDWVVGEVFEIVCFFGGVIVVWLVLVIFIFVVFYILFGFMKLSLEVGDCVFVFKWVYGYLCYFLLLGIGYFLLSSWNGCIVWVDFQCGDVVVFCDECQCDGCLCNLIKCVIGIVGDIIEVCDGRFYINGEVVLCVFEEVWIFCDGCNGLLCIVMVYFQVLFGDIEFDIYEVFDNYLVLGWLFDDYGLVMVLLGMVFVMGDNCDVFNDSCVLDGLGFVLLVNVVGCVEIVMFIMVSCCCEVDFYCLIGCVWRGFQVMFCIF